eukprot:scaffold166592_cov55-Attheya_sp.AAC.7
MAVLGCLCCIVLCVKQLETAVDILACGYLVPFWSSHLRMAAASFFCFRNFKKAGPTFLTAYSRS